MKPILHRIWGKRVRIPHGTAAVSVESPPRAAACHWINWEGGAGTLEISGKRESEYPRGHTCSSLVTDYGRSRYHRKTAVSFGSQPFCCLEFALEGMVTMSMMRQLVRKARVCIRLCAVCFALCFGCLFLSEQALATEVGGAEAETITVTVAIYDYTAGTAGLEAASRTGVVLPPYSLEVPADSMAVDAIEAALQKNYISFTAPEGDYGRYFVEINGLAELDGGPESGWVFRINDVYGNSGVAATELAEGDRLILDYSIEGYGADVGNYWGRVAHLFQFDPGRCGDGPDE